jgi:uncharacterized protein
LTRRDDRLYNPRPRDHVMLAILEQLLIIQDRDRRIAQLKAENARIPGEIAAVDQRLSETSQQLDTLRNQQKHLESERKKLEIEADADRGQITKYRMQLNQIKSNTEYQALLKEIAKVEEEIVHVEDRELEFMEKFEDLRVAIKEAQATVGELTAKAETGKQELKKRAANIEQELAQLQAEREKLALKADPGALARYERLLRSKGDMAIVPIQHGNCGGCHLHLAPQIVHDAKHADTLTSCGFCGRVLYSQAD